MAYYSTQDDISFIPLTEEAERALFLRFYDKSLSEAEQLAARDTLILHHLKFVAKVAIACAKRGLEDEDAISAGNVGLIKALESRSYDPSLGYRFSSYVKTAVRGAVFSAMREHSNRAMPEVFVVGCWDPEALVTGHISHKPPLTSSSMDNALEFSEEHAFEAEDLVRGQRAAIERALLRVKGLEGESVYRHSLEGATFQAIADDHKISRQAVEQAFRRGMRKLKLLLKNFRQDNR